MKRYQFAISTILLLVVLGCKEESGNGTLIDHKYDLILGFMVPDEDRTTPTEIFVGRLKPFNPEQYLVQGVEGQFLREQIFKYVDVYLADAIWFDDAEVTISSSSETVELESTGFGIYRDVENQLHIEPLEEYFLEVKRPGGLIYTDKVFVPGDVFVTNLQLVIQSSGIRRNQILAKQFALQISL